MTWYRFTARPGHVYPLGFTRRTDRRAGLNDPVHHAATGHHTGKSARSSFAALCGAAIVAQPGQFDPTHPRACPRCAASIAAATAGQQ